MKHNVFSFILMATLNGNRDKRHIKTGKEIRSMNIEQVREYALSLYGVTEDQPFGDDNITFRLEGKIFMCLSLGGNEYDIKDSEPRLALKLSPDRNDELRTQFSAVTPAYHWNKKHWSDVYYNQLEDTQVMEWIKESYQLVASKLQKAVRHKYI